MSNVAATLAQDLRFTARQMRRAPGFFLLAVLTLGLGIGAATAVFSVLYTTFLQPLPYGNGARVVNLQMIAQAGYQQPASYPGYLDMRRSLQAFSAVSVLDTISANLRTETGAAPVHVVEGSDDFFDVLGTQPLLGRGFLAGEEQPGRNNVAVLSYGLWQRQFGGRANIVGSPIQLNGDPYTVVGVMPRSFRFPLTETQTIYTPLHPDARMLNNRGWHEFSVIAATKPGVDLGHAQADASRVFAELGRAYPDADAGRTVRVRPLGKLASKGVANALGLAACAAGMLLLIACVNVAGLLFARGVRREQEMALRAAVGASRQRLVRQTVTETLLVALAGAICGSGLAALLIAAMRTFLLKALARGMDVSINIPALAVALALAVLTSLLAGLLPAWRMSGISPNAALRTGTAGAGTNRAQQQLRASLLFTQVALSLALLAVSGLLLQHLRGMLSMDLGYAPDRIVAVRVALAAGDYKSKDPLGDFYHPLLERLAQQPGLDHAGIINMLPLAMSGSNREIQIVGQPPAPANEERLAEWRMVSAGYFDAMGSKLLAGRALTSALDRPETTTYVVNHAFAREFTPFAKSAVGQRVDDASPEKAEIVGEYSDMRQQVDQPPFAEMDMLVDQVALKDRRTDLLHMFLVLRAKDGVAPMSLIPAVRQMVHQLDAGAAMEVPMTLRDVLDDALVFERMQGALFSTFAACAVLLTLVGIYGTVRHEAELRTRDIGVRMALGATRAAVLTGILRRAAVVASAGIVAGLLLTLGAQRTLASLLELRPEHEAILLLALASGLFVVCLGSAFAPARRAAAVDPMQALRSE